MTKIEDRRLETQSNISIVSLQLDRYIDSEIPKAVADTAASELSRRVDQGILRGAWVGRLGQDLHLHLSTCNSDFLQAGAYRKDPLEEARESALKAGLLALQRALDLKAAQPEAQALLSSSPEEQLKALNARCLHLPYRERGAEPIFVAKAIDGSWGFFNRALFNLFFNPDKGSGRRIEGNDYLAVVESIEDLAAGKETIRTYEFGPSEMNELVALIADSEQWRLSGVYAVRGKFGVSELKDEPAALVGGSRHPVMIGRSQSGLPAIGEFTQSVGEFYFGPGGPNGSYRVGLVPANLDQARASVSPAGSARVVAYAYQSYDRGRIPAEPDVVDIFDQNRPETIRLQKDAARLIGHMIGHGEFEPYLNPHVAERLAQEQADEISERFEPIPKSDPLIEGLNQRSLFTISDIKADAGGRVGHTTPPHHFRHVAEASLREAKQKGLISATSEFIEVGDDEHLLMTHTRGADDNAIHLFAYRTFFRQVWFSEVLGHKWYGLGQDLVGSASAGLSTEELANLTDDFLAFLPESLPASGQVHLETLEKAYRDWKAGRGENREPTPVFSGNVSGQGPGFAEIPLTRPQSIGLLAIDKAGPSAFNVPVWRALNQAASDGTLLAYLQKDGASGAVLEIWDVEEHERIFLDVESEKAIAARLLGAVEKFNIKRIWSRGGDRWRQSELAESLQNVLLAASTEKLAVISGGEYLGKDDPVLLAVRPLAQALNQFLRDQFYMTQGDGRGSHYMFPTPLSFRDAIATIYSRAVAVAAWIGLDGGGQITEFRDVFADPIYEAARDRAYSLNKTIWEAQGGNFTPVGVGAAKVEQSYPLAKTLARITAADSPYASQRLARDEGREPVR